MQLATSDLCHQKHLVPTSPPPDTILPSIKITKPLNNSTLPPGTVLVEGTASDNTGGSGVKVVDVQVDGGAYSAATATTPGNWSTWSISLSITTIGSHKILARATDNAGNKKSTSVTITISNTVDTILPSIKITKPLNNSTLPPGTVLVEGTASDNTGGSGVKVVDIQVDGGAYSAATATTPGNWSTWSISLSITTIGSHKILARATDNAGNKKSTSVTITTS